ncbi:MAG: recombination-associated protein RdgC [Betaproteobacteria bacterium]|nr:recombination-associated protein RdgC [Betaproteobacteria bacterium]
MWFRNLQIYRLPAPWALALDTLEAQLARQSFHPCGSQDLVSRGFVAPAEGERLVHAVGGQWLIALGLDQKLLPASVVNQVAAERAEEIAASQGYRPGRKQMREIREAVMQELLPRAFSRRRRVWAWIDPAAGWLAVDAPSAARAEELLEVMRKALDELPLRLLKTRRSPGSAMTQWLAAGEAPGAFTIDQDCELRSASDEKAAVRYVRHALDGRDVRDHLAAGKQTTRLALTFNDRVSFVLSEKGEVKRLAFLDVVREQAPQDARSREEQLDADFALMTGELSRLLPALVEALDGEVEG